MRTNNQSGQISRILIILAVIVFVGIIVVFSVTKIIQTKRSAESSGIEEPPKPVYETTIGEVKFLFKSARNLGSVLMPKESYGKSLITTERFIEVTVGAQNKGKNNIDQYSWDLGNIIDSDGRNFLADNRVYEWLPQPDLCGALLKPEFEPTPCVKIYEVSKESKELKIEVKFGEDGALKKQTSILDLKLTR